jgi:hypothetical protein
MKQEKMQIKFDGQEHQIDANTLINSLIHYNTIILEANREYGAGARNINVKVDAPEKGSFVLNISLQESAGIFSSDTVTYLAGLVTIAGGVFGLYKWLKGKPAKDANDVVSANINGNNNVSIVNSIVNVYNAPAVREAISKSIETANEDCSVQGIRISGKNIAPITFERDQFGSLIYNDFDKETQQPDEQTQVVNDAILTITKLSFENGGQWQFLYNGFKISIIGKDGALMDCIEQGERFGKGDAIKVDMQIRQKYNQSLHGFENKSFRIVKFIDHIIPNNKLKIDD